MSLTPQESTVLDLWDRVLSMQMIAAQTGLKRDNVARILSSFDGSQDQRVQEASIRAGSAALLAAIQEVHL